jgi:hypothetical protein
MYDQQQSLHATGPLCASSHNLKLAAGLLLAARCFLTIMVTTGAGSSGYTTVVHAAAAAGIQ